MGLIKKYTEKTLNDFMGRKKSDHKTISFMSG